MFKISHMADTYDRVREHSVAVRSYERAQLIIELMIMQNQTKRQEMEANNK